MPSHTVALELIRRAGIPVAAPSANRFGHVSPTTAEHVLDDLDGRIDAVLDAGPTLRGVESTVLDPSTSPMTIYRPGAVTAEQIAEIAGPVEEFKSGEPLQERPRQALPSPGVGLKHYAPRARLVLVEGRGDELGARLIAAASAERWRARWRDAAGRDDDGAGNQRRAGLSMGQVGRTGHAGARALCGAAGA